MDRHIDSLERDCVLLLAERAGSTGLFTGTADDVIRPLGLTPTEYQTLMQRMARHGLITDPAPSQYSFRNFVVTDKLTTEAKSLSGLNERPQLDLASHLQALLYAHPALAWVVVTGISLAGGFVVIERFWQAITRAF
jgi:hypothetical protein